ncbi:GGDEF domain-containing protein [Deinococcus metallilatus]|uniref:Diguanylate cyclase (GGDEF)-like protein n=1 Tax=Deinococcus metallilatus TaxID=1211322 RepID=A0AAJ5F3F5_9DEIO|nr:GGDEF domain-containing protein [Deinococcus metallilatus]MBB5296496.1 diguanylate cyclase (GGDEF)-like protein [Deinococcus metallilatus]QBY08472.1 GGDEF domain-containing protein [Deinococcus metallilatus]RXJ11271.1 GGDEF domain-containing protein [Deinococcus metallilatus]TLK24762.1 GGDEF domain-containing protein [Deinococcus metallilatus]GMA17413.1 hypothetical protein GCM10025871_37440 [Deinococcus metallilatus]
MSPRSTDRLLAAAQWLAGRAPRRAYPYALEGVRLAQAEFALGTGDPEQLALMLNVQAYIEADLGLMDAAHVSFRRAYEHAAGGQSLATQLRVLNNHALLYLAAGAHDAAERRLELALAIADESGADFPPECRVAPLTNLAQSLTARGEHDRALHLLDTHRAEELAPGQEAAAYLPIVRAEAHLGLAHRARTLERPQEAQAHLAAALEALASTQRLPRPQNPVMLDADHAVIEGRLLDEQGRHAEAAALLGRALARAAGRYAHGEARLSLARGQALLRARNLPAARSELQAALAWHERLGHTPGRLQALEALAALAESEGQAAEALAWTKQLVATLRGQLATQTRRDAPEDAGPADTQALRAQLEAAETLARRDPLTGLANRRQLDDLLPGLVQQATLLRRPLSVLFVDIDHFKHVNDRHSHAVGDRVLRRVAATLREIGDPEALAARYGGEELLLALPDVPLGEAERLAQRLRGQIDRLTWPDQRPERVTISLGVTQVREDDSALTLLARADALLYAAKQAGRNRVAAAP